MPTKLNDYFKNKMYEVHFFKLLCLNDKDYTTFKVISTSKKRTAAHWYGNNILFPFIVILLPWSLTWVHYFFDSIEFNKSLVDILIGGSISLLGINVLRTSSTLISEKLNRENVPAELVPNLEEVETEILNIKQKLSRRSWILSIIGMIFYFLQIGLLVKNNGGAIYIFICLIFIFSFISIFLGRFISLLETNIFDKEDAIRLLFKKLINQENEFEKLEQQLNNQGLL